MNSPRKCKIDLSLWSRLDWNELGTKEMLGFFVSVFNYYLKWSLKQLFRVLLIFEATIPIPLRDPDYFSIYYRWASSSSSLSYLSIFLYLTDDGHSCLMMKRKLAMLYFLFFLLIISLIIIIQPHPLLLYSSFLFLYPRRHVFKLSPVFLSFRQFSFFFFLSSRFASLSI